MWVFNTVSLAAAYNLKCTLTALLWLFIASSVNARYWHCCVSSAELILCPLTRHWDWYAEQHDRSEVSSCLTERAAVINWQSRCSVIKNVWSLRVVCLLWGFVLVHVMHWCVEAIQLATYSQNQIYSVYYVLKVLSVITLKLLSFDIAVLLCTFPGNNKFYSDHNIWGKKSSQLHHKQHFWHWHIDTVCNFKPQVVVISVEKKNCFSWSLSLAILVTLVCFCGLERF